MNRSSWIAASLLLVLGLFWVYPWGSLGRGAFAETIPGVDSPGTITWTTTYYSRVTSADKKRTWLHEERRFHAYRHPGQYRETFLDKTGKPKRIEITDARVARMLVLDPKEKKAVLKTPQGYPDVRGPFAWVGEALRDRVVAKVLRVKSLSLEGTREIDGIQANVVRAMIVENEDRGPVRRDFLFDTKSKRLVAIYITNESDFDPETAPERKQAAEEKTSILRPVAGLEHEIVLDPKLDAADFRLDPPAGYAYEAQAKPTITEEEMVSYLGAAARFNGGVFPDSPYAAFDQPKFNAASMKPDNDRTPAERELVGLHDKFLIREVFTPPLRRFVEDHTEPASFHYVGAGATVGQANRLICWFTTKGTTKHRAVFADLSVRDVERSELPLDLAP